MGLKWGCESAILRHKWAGPGWLLMIQWACLDLVFGGPSALATRFGLGPSGNWLSEGVWWAVARHTHVITCIVQACNAPYTFTYLIARWPKAKSGGQDLMVYHRPSQHAPIGSQKSTKGQCNWAPDCCSNTLFRPIPLFSYIYFSCFI